MKIHNDYEKVCIQYLELLRTIDTFENEKHLTTDLQKELNKHLLELEKEILSFSTYNDS